MVSPITASNDTTVSDVFNRTNPTPFPEAEAAVVSEKSNNLTGFFQDQVNISPQAQQKSQTEQQINSTERHSKPQTPSDESVQVSSSIGRAASSGDLNRQQALAIYQKIAALI